MNNYAWVRLNRLCGCNYKVAITRKGASVYVPDPQVPGKRYRLDAAKFDADKWQGRDSWAITPWTERAERTTESERNWQD